MALSNNQKKLKKEHEELVFTKTEVFVIEYIVYVTSKFIQDKFSITARQVTNWKKKGLEESKYSVKTLRLFDLEYVTDWHKINVNKSQSDRTSSTRTSEEGESDEEREETNLDLLTTPEAERRKKIEDLKLATRKNEIEEKLYIPIEDSDIAMAELAGTMISFLGNLRDIIPTEAEFMSRDDIAVILDGHFKDSINDLAEIVNNTTQENVDASVYDILFAVIRQGKNGVSTDDMIKTLKEIK